jgi:hypothetical protein
MARAASGSTLRRRQAEKRGVQHLPQRRGPMRRRRLVSAHVEGCTMRARQWLRAKSAMSRQSPPSRQCGDMLSPPAASNEVRAPHRVSPVLHRERYDPLPTRRRGGDAGLAELRLCRYSRAGTGWPCFSATDFMACSYRVAGRWRYRGLPIRRTSTLCCACQYARRSTGGCRFDIPLFCWCAYDLHRGAVRRVPRGSRGPGIRAQSPRLSCRARSTTTCRQR